jgi:hypothetical protein
MAYPALLGRQLGRSVINLGFSGNGRAEPEVARLLAELDPAIFVLDPLPNVSGPGVTALLEEFITILKLAPMGQRPGYSNVTNLSPEGAKQLSPPPTEPEFA